MIGRIWHTRVQAARAHEYEEFARTKSLPMFRKQQGFCGTLMLRRGEECQVISLWRSMEDIAVLDRSESYKETVAEILSRGFLHGEQTTEVYEAHLVAFGTEEVAGSQGLKAAS